MYIYIFIDHVDIYQFIQALQGLPTEFLETWPCQALIDICRQKAHMFDKDVAACGEQRRMFTLLGSFRYLSSKLCERNHWNPDVYKERMIEIDGN